MMHYITSLTREPYLQAQFYLEIKYLDRIALKTDENISLLVSTTVQITFYVNKAADKEYQFRHYLAYF